MTTPNDIPFCAGPILDIRAPWFEMPENACDTHFHIFPAGTEDTMTPRRSYTPPVASIEMYNTMSEHLGLSRGVLIQPSVYVENNAALVAANAAAPDRLRGVVTVTSAITDTELEEFHAAGERGIRVNIVDSGGMPFRDLEAWGFTSRIAGLDWPHPRHPGIMPNDGALLDQLADWGAGADLREEILVANSERFYGF